ncbi:MAG: hypothetical protein M0Z61_16575 [Nitrospiraceae bacterium]|nr:hypothetical protein [Nitrospiraceae bacterium]
MTKRVAWEIVIGLSLVALSAALFFAQAEIFHRTSDSFFYLMQALAFLPIQVLLVTVILDRLLALREKQDILRKINMVIGTFFSDAGTELLRLFLELGPISDHLIKELHTSDEWGNGRFAAAINIFRALKCQVNVEAESLERLKHFMAGNRDFLLAMLENPALMEHDSFTDLLLAVFHVADELSHRKSMSGLPESDYTHLAGDIQRAYQLLVLEWLFYMKHLKKEYPYLFSLAVRTNPFNARASAIVRQ